jgi:hypothetical protein
VITVLKPVTGREKAIKAISTGDIGYRRWGATARAIVAKGDIRAINIAVLIKSIGYRSKISPFKKAIRSPLDRCFIAFRISVDPYDFSRKMWVLNRHIAFIALFRRGQLLGRYRGEDGRHSI